MRDARLRACLLASCAALLLLLLLLILLLLLAGTPPRLAPFRAPAVLVQFVPLLSVPLLLALFPAKYSGAAPGLLGGLACYALAKLAEHWDRPVFQATGRRVSGHTLKHLLSAMAPLCVALMLSGRGAGAVAAV